MSRAPRDGGRRMKTEDMVVHQAKVDRLQKRVKLLEGALLDLIVFGGAVLDPDDEESRKIAEVILSGAINRARVILDFSRAALARGGKGEG